MASRTLFPPIVNSTEPAFVTTFGGGNLKIYFSLPSLVNSSSIGNFTVHARVLRKQDSLSVINKKSNYSSKHYTATGAILNLTPSTEPEMGKNYYSIVISGSDLESESTLSGKTFKGWIPGWEYKIQIRTSEERCMAKNETEEWQYINNKSSKFSEWSSYCYTKAISEMDLTMPIFNFSSLDKKFNNDTKYRIAMTEFAGSIVSSIEEANEDFESVQMTLYQREFEENDWQEVERSDKLFKKEGNTFNYEFKINFEREIYYKIELIYTTESGYISKPFIFQFEMETRALDIIEAVLQTIETADGFWDNETSLEEEEEEGKIGLKIRSSSLASYTGNICIRRSSMRDGFAYWEDIKYVTFRRQNLNDYPVIYDYTIESGVQYKYGIQSISINGERGELNIISEPVMRTFEHCYLLGKNGQQLKLCFDNHMGSYKYNVLENKVDTIGSQYPFIGRNGNVNYRTFPIEGLISFWMDENNTFLKNTFMSNGKKGIFDKKYLDTFYSYNENKNIVQYDYTFEREFREKVLAFLMDGKPKLFKSPTEGNIIVRLMDVNCSPNQSLSRLIYNFNCNAIECNVATMTNYLKYGFYNPGTYSTDFAIQETRIGQLIGNFSSSDNIFEKIYLKYDNHGEQAGGYKFTLDSIEQVKITLGSKSTSVINNANDEVIGRNIILNGNTITLYGSQNVYEIDSLLKFTYNSNGGDSLYIIGHDDSDRTEAIIDFIYSRTVDLYPGKQIKDKTPTTVVGQYFETVYPNNDIYGILKYKYYFETSNTFKRLKETFGLEIQAPPHSVFCAELFNDISNERYYEINETGILHIYDIASIKNLSYIGKRMLIDNPVSAEDPVTQEEKIVGGEFTFNKSSVTDKYVTETIEVQDMYNFNEMVILKAPTDILVTYKIIVLNGHYRED